MLKKAIYTISILFFAFTSFAAEGDAQPDEMQGQNRVITNITEEMSSDSEEDGSFEEEAEEEEKDTLEVSNAWARVSLSSNNNSAAYMTINNPTNRQITILGASAAMIANNVELHKSFVDEKGISRMTSIDKIVVPANSSISLAPGGIHIMLFDLKRRLNVGDNFQLMLALEDMDAIVVDVEVK